MTFTPEMLVKHFAVIGDVHDHFCRMIDKLERWERSTGKKLDFVLQVGDLQPNRHQADLDTMAAPQKFRKLGDFHKLNLSGHHLPWPMYFIGGNHEPYGWLDLHPEGATLAPNIHYLGRCGATNLAGLRVVGLSGIYSEVRFNLLRPPVHQILQHSRKHYTFYNEEDVQKALDQGEADILLLHEWPQGLLAKEDAAEWSHFKGGVTVDGKMGKFGSEYGRLLIEALKPAFVFCGHMHEAYEGDVISPIGTKTKVYCLSDIAGTDVSVRFFSAENGQVRLCSL